MLAAAVLLHGGCSLAPRSVERKPLAVVQTAVGIGETRFGEVFGAAVDKNGAVYFADGANGKIWKTSGDGAAVLVTDKLDTPSQIAFDKDGSLIIADAGSHTIKRINAANGKVSIVAGVENQAGLQNGAAQTALFRAPVGVAVGADGKIFVADSYNDAIRKIENGVVTTIAGGKRGFADDNNGAAAEFDTPCGIAVLADGDVLIADTGNRRIRRVDKTGAVTTFAGTGAIDSRGVFGYQTSFVEPVGVAVDEFGIVYVADAGANAVRVYGRHLTAFWETLSGGAKRGLVDSAHGAPEFNRPTNVAVSAEGSIYIADSANKTLRVYQSDKNSKFSDAGADAVWQRENLFLNAEKMKNAGEPRWTFDPPFAAREIAGTFGEVRGAIKETNDAAWFHNGLDVAGAYGETTRFIRAEKVLRPLAAEDFNAKNNRERLRMPTIGYIHLRLGRDQNNKPFNDQRFLFNNAQDGKMIGVRVPRGAKFNAGDAVGTLNAFNHVHLIAGETGAEMNAFTALQLPGVKDSVAPKIEKVTLYDESWREIKTGESLRGKVRIIVRAFDQMDGSNARRKLGVYKLGYQIANGENALPAELNDESTTISFARLPEDSSAASIVYAVGSQSGYTPETIFNYAVTNFVQNGEAREQLLDTAKYPDGTYRIRVYAADFFGNQTTQDLTIQIKNNAGF